MTPEQQQRIEQIERDVLYREAQGLDGLLDYYKTAHAQIKELLSIVKGQEENIVDRKEAAGVAHGTILRHECVNSVRVGQLATEVLNAINALPYRKQRRPIVETEKRRTGYKCDQCGSEVVYETDAAKNEVLKDAIDRAVLIDPTRFTTRSFAVIWNAGHSVRLVKRDNPSRSISIPWGDLDALRVILGADAVSMRSACVEKVKSVAADHRVMAEKFTGKAIGEMQLIRAEECDILAKSLESVSIQEQK